MSSRHGKERSKKYSCCIGSGLSGLKSASSVRMQPADALLGTLHRLGAPVMLYIGLLLLRGLRRKPGRLPLYIRRAAGIWETVRFIRRLFTYGKMGRCPSGSVYLKEGIAICQKK